MSGRLLAVLLFVAMGLWLGVAVRQELLYQGSLTYRRFVALSALLEEQARREDLLRAALARLAATAVPALPERRLAALRSALRAARRAGGRTAVTGEGVVVTLSDAPLPGGPVGDVNDYLIHDVDLLALVDQLNAAGATAIAINGQRLVATTAVHCVGPVISINGVRTAPPIRVVAVGPPAELAAAAVRPGGIVSLLRLYGFPVTVRPGRVRVPAYRRLGVPAPP